MRLSYAKFTFSFYCHPNNRQIAKDAGFTFNWHSKCWETKDRESARKLLEYADQAALDALGGEPAPVPERPRELGPPEMVMDGGRYILERAYDLSDQLRNSPFAEIEYGRWHTTDFVAANAYRHLTEDPVILAHLDGKMERYTSRLKMSRAEDSSLEIPLPPGRELYPYQRAGLEYLLGEPKVILADDPGLGKSVMGACMFNLQPNLTKGLVICPPSLIPVWNAELRRWLVNYSLGIYVVTSQFYPIAHNIAESGKILIIHYLTVWKWVELLKKEKFDFIICDECAWLANKGARMTKSVLQLKAPRELYMSGTFFKNKSNKEMWNALNHLDAKRWRWKGHFDDRYCQLDRARNVEASNSEELQERMRGTIMVRRRKQDVLKDLPPKTRQTIWVPRDEAVIREEQAVTGRLISEMEAIQEEIAKAEAAMDEMAFRAAVKKMRRLKFTGERLEMTEARRKTAMAKLDFIIEDTKQILQEQEKHILVCHHGTVVDALASAFKKECVWIDQRIAVGEKREAKKQQFLQDPKTSLMVCTYGTMGEGHTLTVASTMGIVELPHKPSELKQMEDRIHRLSQLAEALFYRYYMMEQTIDVKMMISLISKIELFEKAMDNLTPLELLLLEEELANAA